MPSGSVAHKNMPPSGLVKDDLGREALGHGIGHGAGLVAVQIADLRQVLVQVVVHPGNP